MAEAGKKASAPGRNERRRLIYLKERLKELRNEMQAIRTETADLRQKLGIGGKDGAEGGPKKAGAGKKKKAAAAADE